MSSSNIIQLSNSTNSTTPGTELLGYTGLIVASVLWGANNLPVKHYETGNGMFFQFIVGIAIWSTGIVIHAVRGFPKFQPFALLGGFFWSMGNLTTVPVIRCLGIGVGSLFNNVVGLIVGWFYARYGLFGIKEELPSNPVLNYVGVALAVISCVVFFFVKTEEQQVLDKNIKSKEETNLLEVSEADIFEKMSQNSRRILGIVLSILAGAMYGLAYMPILWCQDNIAGTSHNQNDYAFAMSTGIFLSSSLYFCVYSVWTRNNPKIYSELVFPSLAIGWIWGGANTAYFLSNNSLEQSVSFPIVNSGQVIVAFVLGLIYREIKGFTNLATLFLGLLIAIAGIICCGLSY